MGVPDAADLAMDTSIDYQESTPEIMFGNSLPALFAQEAFTMAPHETNGTNDTDSITTGMTDFAKGTFDWDICFSEEDKAIY